MWRTLTLVLAAFLCVPLPERADAAFTASTLTLYPAAKTCERMQFSIAITSDGNIVAGETVTLKMPYTTAGNCENSAGSSFTGIVMDTAAEALVSADWTEGTVANMFSESLITFTVKTGQTLSATTAYTFNIDAMNGLKLIGKPLASPTFTLSTNAATGTVTDFTVATITSITSTGFFITKDEISFSNGAPKRPTEVVITFRPAFNLATNDVLVLELPGMTSGAADGVAGSNIGSVTVVVAPAASTMACAWTEGTAPTTPLLRGFDDSKLTCTMSASHAAGTDLAITVSMTSSQSLKAQCGLPGNSGHEHHEFTLKVTDNGGTVLLPATSIHKVQAIGQHCQELNFCNGNGYCDMCMGKCHCHRGYGNQTEDGTYFTSDDPLFLNHAADCSQRVCPAGPAFASVPTSASAAHALKECSGNGRCNRGSGRCECFDNFHGQACEFMKCPVGGNGEICSGHGMCKSMRELARDASALPLTTATTDLYNYDVAGTWDYRSNFACVCDSSEAWLSTHGASAVGLASGEIQEVGLEPYSKP